jgi:ACS family glucarate transporter-like MFS transporter
MAGQQEPDATTDGSFFTPPGTVPVIASRAQAPLPNTVFLLMLVVACAHFNRVGISVAGTERLIPEAGISPDRMGLVYSAYLAIYTLAMLPGGLLIDRFGARRALLVLGFGSAIFVAMTGCTGLVFHTGTSVWLGLLVVRSFLGLVSAPLHPGAANLVCEQAPSESKSTANGLVNSAACAGIAGTYLVMGKLIDLFDWPIAFLITGGVTLAVALAWTSGTTSTRRTQAVSAPSAAWDLSQVRYVLRHRSVICITLSYAAYGYFQYMFFYWITYYFETIRHEDASVSRWYSTVITLAMGVGMISGGWLTDHVPRRFSPWVRRAIVPVLGMFASGAVFEAGILARSPQATLLAFAMSAALLGMCEAPFWTTAVELGGSAGGTAAGMLNTGGNAGGTLSPYLTPLLSSFFTIHYGADVGWRLGLAVAGAIVALGGILWWGVGPGGEAELE